MIPLFVYKGTHLRRQITRAYLYKNKGVKEQRKRNDSLQCRGVTLYYIGMRSL